MIFAIEKDGKIQHINLFHGYAKEWPWFIDAGYYTIDSLLCSRNFNQYEKDFILLNLKKFELFMNEPSGESLQNFNVAQMNPDWYLRQAYKNPDLLWIAP